MTDTLLAPAVTLPVLTDAQRAALRPDVLSAYPGDGQSQTYWRNPRTDIGLWQGASRDTELLSRTPEWLMADNWPSTAQGLDIWNEAHNELAARARVDWSTAVEADSTGTNAMLSAVDEALNREILAEFDGPIPDTKLAKLREIVTSERNARAELDRVNRELLAARQQLDAPIDVSDPRVRQYFARAAVEADRQGYCSTYEGIAEAAGLPGRSDFTGQEIADAESYFSHEYRVTMRQTIEFDVIVEASNEENAYQAARDLDYYTQWEQAEVDSQSVVGETVISASVVD